VRIAIVGGGPAGLYCGLLLKRLDPGREITIYERNPPDATYGWGVVFSERTLGAFQDADYKTYREITDRFVLWEAMDIVYRGEVIHTRGQAFAGIARTALLGILQRRCAELDVALRFRTEVGDDLRTLGGDDLIVAGDGVNSVVRAAYARAFRPTIRHGVARYIWLGTHRPYDAFTFIFRETPHGLFQAHVYPFDGTASTFIVECPEAVWQRAGLAAMGEAEGIAFCERLFTAELRGHRLLSNNSRWITFPTLTTQTWHHGKVVLLGDAAHTAHFSIGSGTKLAMEDAIALAGALEQRTDLEAALDYFEADRRPVVEAFQEAAADSQRYFEHIDRYTHMGPIQFAFHLLTRSGRMTCDDLRLRDPSLVARAAAWVAMEEDAGGPAPLNVPSPALIPLHLRGVTLPNRIALAAPPTETAREGIPDAAYAEALVSLARRGAGAILTEPVAVSAGGRVTPGSPGLYSPEHRAAWARIASAVRDTGGRLALHVAHAGRRGATRSREFGLDRPLAAGGWPLLAASPLRYTPSHPVPREMTRMDMARVREDFARAARMAAEAGVDLLVLSLAHGYLLGGFLSPVANVRKDEYGGTVERRMRFPLEVVEAVREAWPADRPLGATLCAEDGVPGGTPIEDAVAVARTLRARGVDLMLVSAGQTTPSGIPRYDRRYLPALSDQVRNEARVATLAAGVLTSLNDVETIVAGGQADLCLLIPRPSAAAPWVTVPGGPGVITALAAGRQD